MYGTFIFNEPFESIRISVVVVVVVVVYSQCMAGIAFDMPSLTFMLIIIDKQKIWRVCLTTVFHCITIVLCTSITTREFH